MDSSRSGKSTTEANDDSAVVGAALVVDMIVERFQHDLCTLTVTDNYVTFLTPRRSPKGEPECAALYRINTGKGHHGIGLLGVEIRIITCVRRPNFPSAFITLGAQQSIQCLLTFESYQVHRPIPFAHDCCTEALCA
jgi:hypothetical protein